jgi:hypothetical protein
LYAEKLKYTPKIYAAKKEQENIAVPALPQER